MAHKERIWHKCLNKRKMFELNKQRRLNSLETRRRAVAAKRQHDA